MAEEKKPLREEEEGKKEKFSLRNIFYHNTFVLAFSFTVALVAWFAMAMQSTDSNQIVRDVPITVQYSPAAEEDGLRVFNMSYNSADLEIAGNSLITSKLTAEDFSVTVTLNPTSTKLTGNTMQKVTVPVRPVKRSSISDYNIVSFSPEEINLEYDRYKEVTLPIENGIKYSADTGFVSGTVIFSQQEVTISGPESSVNKISRAAVSYSVESPLRADDSFSCPVRLYDQNNMEIEDTTGLYLDLSVDTVDVSIPILPKKTVTLKAATVHQPKGFADARITVEPQQIDIAGPAEVLSGINEITLDTPIDFAELEVGQGNVITMDIPLPTGVKNVSAAGSSGVSQATVSVNLNGYRSIKVEVPADNIQITNSPAGMDCSLTTLFLDVSVMGSEAQVTKLTGDSLSIQADLTNFSDRPGSVEVPVTVTISGSGADSCWALGKYTVSMVLTESAAAQTDAEPVSSDAVNAAPQE